MNKNSLQLFLVLYSMVAVIVGVGFISGSEIYYFFTRFGYSSCAGVVVFFILIYFITYKILLEYVHSENLLKMNKNTLNNTNFTFLAKLKIKNILQIINTILLSGAMFSGLKQVIGELFINNKTIIFCVCVLAVFFILMFGIDNLKKFNFITIVLVTIILVILFLDLLKIGINEKFNLTKLSFKNITLSSVFAVLYLFMNVAGLKPAIDNLNINITKRHAKTYALYFSLIISFILSFISVYLFLNNSINENAMPLFTVFKKKGGVVSGIFVVVLIFCILSTLVTCLFSFQNMVRTVIKNKIIYSGFTTLVALILGFIDFKFFISFIYPIIGIMNLIIYVFL